MSFLFVDSTYDISLGILDDNLEWIDFKTFSGQKASSVLQTETFKMLLKNGLEAKNLEALFTVAGPGFYTGLRLAEGLADVFKFFNIPHYSVYSYEVPLWCGHEEGTWFTKAYRGEYFLHQWHKLEVASELITTANVQTRLSEITTPLFVHSVSSLDNLSVSLLGEYTTTLNLFQTSSSLIFKKMLNEKFLRESFYFRAPEDEFRANP